MAKKKEEPKFGGQKKQLSFTLREGVKNRFTSHCDENMLNKSQFLERLIIDFFEKKDFEGMKKTQ